MLYIKPQTPNPKLGVFLFQLSKQTCNKKNILKKMLQNVQQKNQNEKKVAKSATKKMLQKNYCHELKIYHKNIISTLSIINSN